jgi:group I intron endonuclease
MNNNSNNNRNNFSNFQDLLIFENAAFVFNDPLNQRDQMLKNLNKKSGIYCWFNTINCKYYIGSSVNLNSRISDYYQEHYYKDKNNLTIVKALVKYGMGNFKLIILELTEKENTLTREQYYLDKYEPEYNILALAGNSLGLQHTESTKEKMREKALGRKHSLEVRQKMSENRKGENNNFFGKTHSEENLAKLRERAQNRITYPKSGFEVEVTDLEDNSTTVYKSMREVTRALNTHMSTLINREKSGNTRPFRGRYIITVKRL